MNLLTEPPDFKKITQLTTESVLVFSGSGPDGEEIIRTVKDGLRTNAKQSVLHIAEVVRSAYIDLKKQRAEETILKPLLGADFSQFQTLCGQSSSSQILQQVLGLLMQHNINLEVLVAGLDDAGGAQLFVAVHPGTNFPMGTSGFATIGSGSLHAAVRMSSGQGQHSRTASLVDTIHNVYEAKKASEVAPGVGKLTDLAIIRDGTMRFAGKDLFDILEVVHKEKPALGEEDRNKLQGAYETIARNN